MLEIRLPCEVQNNLCIVGIMGGICSGKSTVSKMFESFGMLRLDADSIANQSLLTPEVKKEVVQNFGEECLENGQIQRKKLAKIVFGDTNALKKLESILHPIVRSTIIQQLYELGQEPPKKYVMLDIPLLWESGWYTICNYLIFVDAPFELRKMRATIQRNWGDDEIVNREKFQANLESKKNASQYIIPNQNNPQETQRIVQKVWEEIKNGK